MAKTQWDLTLLYKNEHDPDIERDIQRIEKAYRTFAKKYKDVSFVSSPTRLAGALRDHERLMRTIVDHKPMLYFLLRSEVNTKDAFAVAKVSQLQQRLTIAGNQVVFFELAIGAIPVRDQKKYLAHHSLRPYQYMLEQIFKVSEHMLSEKEEQLQDLLSQPSYAMWVDANQRLLAEQVITYKKKKIPLNTAVEQVLHIPSLRDRHIMYDAILQCTRSVSHVAEAEINAVMTYKKIMDERRGYAHPYSATILGYEHDEKTVIALVDMVTKYFRISHRFHKLQAQLLGRKTITMADRAISPGKIKKKFNFTDGSNIIRESLDKVDTRYTKIFNQFLEKGQIDAFPGTNKKGGGYCCSMATLPTFILMNYVNDLRSVETMAHEMGHAFHAECSRSQPLYYWDHSTATAEVASTFFEGIVSDYLEKLLSDDEKIIFLHNKIFNDISTIFRQVACFNFENQLHHKIRAEGFVGKKDIAALMQQNMQSYVGPAVRVSEDDGYTFVRWSHIRNFFYVYSYAFGQLVSKALLEKWKKDPKFIDKVNEFLSMGGSQSLYEIFKKIGLDTSDPKFFEIGLKSIEADIIKLEKLVSKKSHSKSKSNKK